ncbi:MAG: oligosaccharide flippase family protein [Thermoleophilia bacterium]|nr:oligosaccharide flippase family protein [Thermoleophilia bacterium]
MVEGPSPEQPRGRRPSFAASAILTYGTNLAVALLSLGNVMVVSRALGPTGRGDVVFLTTMAILTSNVSAMGVHQANINIAGAEPERRRALATNSVILAGLFGLGSAAALLGLIEAFPGLAGESDPSLRWLALGVIPVMILGHFLHFIVQADYAFKAMNAAWLLAPLTNIVVNGALAGAGVLSVGAAMGTWVAGQTLSTLMYVWVVWRRLAGFGRPDARLARRSVAFGIKAHPGAVMQLGNYRLDQWLLGSLAGSRELGLYSVAVAWAEALFYLPTALVMVQRPDLVRAPAEEARRLATAVFRSAVVLTSPIAVGMVLAAPFLCVTIFGEDFRGSIDDLRVLVPGAFGILSLKLLGSALTAQSRPLRESAAIGTSFACTIGLDLALIPELGGLGAATASSLAYVAGGTAAVLIFARTLDASLRELAPRPADVHVLASQVRRVIRRPSPPTD